MARVDRHNTARYWNATGVDGLSCLHADFTTHDYAPHQHEAFVVAVTESGGSEFKSRGRSDEARESVLLVFNPAEPHSGRMGWSKRWRYRSFYLTQPAIDQVTTDLGIDRPAYFMRNVVGDADLIAAFGRLHRSLDDGHDPLEERELLVASFGQLFARHGDGAHAIPTAPRDEAALSLVTRRMASQHAESGLSLTEMGLWVDMTPFQLISLFKRTAGLTPHAYLTQLRLKSAIRQLKAGAPIADAALASGFYDQSALTRHFKRSFGITPLQYQRAGAVGLAR
ncbi:AraC-type DNA-binding protein [Bosea sp. 62]|uniref:helix-turn-helix domain-containing protein n=1 Tax=unclassified Bosea (in: a-proteobacteria) TaxID=2653178 RepID=UPI001251EBAC|nr:MULTISPECIES: AraC family transcriptional regulator [unclassified Bosea (in: a-proteobacteria)]CAD5248768.1 AraC-type DNA-binding protein [Bosea sp. 46]CAD5249918.1 AraC-type DNA-binding protein [Bosea sp. 21B]CAD5266022.1 AraC-type DNA-binding protein [Bosea sp. 7B]VVT44718.1 AraC-type DNA-binding protein [Bosea sp. EC-HK365B]VXB04792.1 AraC-type DNA-binding protein [Bosea sp. 29B]